jgi:Domain of unknown function (DUF6379)
MAIANQSSNPPLPQTSLVIGPTGITAAPDGVRIDVRLPWYRSLPLSTVEVAEVTVDGRRVDPSSMTFELEGRRFALDQLPDQVSTVWYVLDSAYLVLRGVSIKTGTEAQVGVTLAVYPPYIRGLKRMTAETKTLRVGAAIV